MEETIKLLNLFSAVVMLVVGIYMQFGLTSLLSPSIRVVITSGALLYFFMQLLRGSADVKQNSGLKIE